MSEEQFRVEYVVIHHSASDKETSCEQIRTWHLERGWDDIGYHWIINYKGELTPGRCEAVVGAHAKGLNFHSIGVCCVGNFENESPSSEMVRVLKEVVTHLCYKHGVPSDNIIGHRDVIKLRPEATVTVCPGEGLYMVLPMIRSEVFERLKSIRS